MKQKIFPRTWEKVFQPKTKRWKWKFITFLDFSVIAKCCRRTIASSLSKGQSCRVKRGNKRKVQTVISLNSFLFDARMVSFAYKKGQNEKAEGKSALTVHEGFALVFILIMFNIFSCSQHKQINFRDNFRYKTCIQAFSKNSLKPDIPFDEHPTHFGFSFDHSSGGVWCEDYCK